MGRAMRWLKGLLSDGGRRKPEGDRNAKGGKEKKGWGFARSFRDKERGGGDEVFGRRGLEEKKGMVAAGFFRGSSAVGDGDDVLEKGGDQQNKRAIAVAAATAAAAEAAVAAAQAAAAVVRLTSTGRGPASWRSAEDCAAVQIQAVFRGYLARRALKALKGLVKLQALVRGHIVRKQAFETLRCMQALVRAQSRARAGREIRISHRASKGSRQQQPIPQTPTNGDSKICTNGAKVRSASAGKNGTRTKKMDFMDNNLQQSSAGNWLDRWVEERYWDGREALSTTGAAIDDERNEKILEVDAGRPLLNAKQRTNEHKMFPTYGPDTHSYMTVPDSPSKDSTVAQYSVQSPSSVCMQQSLSPLRLPYETEDVCGSPQFYSASSRTGSSVRGPFTLTKNKCSRRYFNGIPHEPEDSCESSHFYSASSITGSSVRGSFTPINGRCSRSHFNGFSCHPNYMSNTESSRAKLRSHSAPRQRPEFEKSGPGKRTSAIGHGDDDLSSTVSQRSSLHLKFTGKAYPGSGRLDKMGMPIRAS